MSLLVEKKHKDLKFLLRKKLYQHEQVNLMTKKAKETVTYLFKTYMKKPELLTNELQRKIKLYDKKQHEQKKARMIADYIAGMTDRFALSECDRIT